jgi:hypothetical protein
MSPDLGPLLREGIERFTGDLKASPDAARRAVRKYRRRRMAVVAAVACVIAGGTAGGYAAAGLRTAGPSRVVSASNRLAGARTVAYVLHRAVRAAADHQLIGYARSVDLVPAYRDSDLYQINWSYGMQGISPAGMSNREVLEGSRIVAEYADDWGRGKVTSTAVEYQTQTWYRGSQPYSYTPQPGCGTASLSDSYAFLSWGERCVSGLRLAGQARVNGVQTIAVVSASGSASPVLELWLNSHTYLPVRTVFDTGSVAPAIYQVDEITNYQWLPPTAANLAQLAAHIPKGFRWDRWQPLANLCGFIPCD